MLHRAQQQTYYPFWTLTMLSLSHLESFSHLPCSDSSDKEATYIGCRWLLSRQFRWKPSGSCCCKRKSTYHLKTSPHVRTKNVRCCWRTWDLPLQVLVCQFHHVGECKPQQLGISGSKLHHFWFPQWRKSQLRFAASCVGKHLFIEKAFIFDLNTWPVQKIKSAMHDWIGNL